jgi:pyridinium-3,5-bisthiocarboxylic acid mononucleotide nickel chelatase
MLAYFDCFSGISGDMTLGAMIDLGVEVEWLETMLGGMPLSGFGITVKAISVNGIRARRLSVSVQENATTRNYARIQELIENSRFSDTVKRTSLEIFRRIAEAEAGVHGCPVEKVHFHEVGGVDALVDILGTCLCLERLAITRVMASEIPLGTGFVSCMHGTIPVPAPATLSILKGVPVYGSGVKNELVTPTGAAIIAATAESYGNMPEMQIHKIGYGAGTRESTERPNLLRVVTGNSSAGFVSTATGSAMVVEATIDDMNPELYGFLMERLFEDGALDVCLIPVFMKKNRPGTLVQVLCKRVIKDVMIQRILSETTSLGVRYYDVGREMLSREVLFVETPFGETRVKKVTGLDGEVRMVPEYEACKKIALAEGIPIRTVYDIIISRSK